jgi:hypothetical protein
LDGGKEIMEIKLNEITLSKDSLLDLIGSITSDVTEGIVDPVKMAAKCDFVIKACTEVKTQIKDQVLNALEKDKQRTEYYGYKIEVSETGVTYDFTNCNDGEYQELIEKLEAIKSELKERETFLKSIKDSLDIIQYGEAKTIYPPVKKSSTSPKFTLK